MMSASPSNASPEFDPDFGELGEVPTDMAFKHRFHGVRIDVQLVGDQRGDARRPLHPGIAFTAREAEHGRDRARPIDEFALDLCEADASLLRLDDFVSGARAEERHIAFGLRAGIAQRLLNGIDRGARDRLPLIGLGSGVVRTRRRAARGR